MIIHHIAIYANDLEVMMQFFKTYFNTTSVKQYHNPHTGLRSYMLSFDDGSRLELMNRPEVKPCGEFDAFRHGLTHFSMSVGSKENVDALTARLQDDSYEVLSGPRTTGDGYYESCIKAPENIMIEITI